MKYIGGKQRIGKRIANFIYQYSKRSLSHFPKIYLEPFCGALGVMQHMTQHFSCCYASDIQMDIIKLWNGIKTNTFIPPKSLSKTEWLKLKNNKKSSALKAFAGFGCSFNGIYFSSYANHNNRDIPGEAYRALQKIKPHIKNISFKCIDYKNINPKNMLIYCDPPYYKYKNKGSISNLFKEFNHEEFLGNNA